MCRRQTARCREGNKQAHLASLQPAYWNVHYVSSHLIAAELVPYLLCLTQLKRKLLR